jgi:hypothetical protein
MKRKIKKQNKTPAWVIRAHASKMQSAKCCFQLGLYEVRWAAMCRNQPFAYQFDTGQDTLLEGPILEHAMYHAR